MTEHIFDRHPKWQRVEPGTVIPAGQPYRVEHDPSKRDWQVAEGQVVDVDSSWKPPLVLPTEPTWGIAVNTRDFIAGQWSLGYEGNVGRLVDVVGGSHWFADRILDFIPLTDEQVARIEATR